MPHHLKFSDGENSDAKILNYVLASNVQEVKNWLQEDDIIIEYRGFRDSAEILDKLDIKMEMPSFLQKGQKQHSTEDGNNSRLVTKVCLYGVHLILVCAH